MEMLAPREPGLGLEATVKVMVVVPVPLAGIPFTQNGTPLLVQPQPPAVLTLNVLEPPPAGAL